MFTEEGQRVPSPSFGTRPNLDVCQFLRGSLSLTTTPPPTSGEQVCPQGPKALLTAHIHRLGFHMQLWLPMLKSLVLLYPLPFKPIQNILPDTFYLNTCNKTLLGASVLCQFDFTLVALSQLLMENLFSLPSLLPSATPPLSAAGLTTAGHRPRKHGWAGASL